MTVSKHLSPTLIAHLLIICLALMYLLAKVFLITSAPPITLNLTLESDHCHTLNARHTPQSLFTKPEEIIQTLTLSSNPTVYVLEIPTTVRTVYVDPCDKGQFTLKGLSLSSSRGSINYALETGDLQCYGCQIIKRPDSFIEIVPTSPSPSFVIGNVHKKVPFLLPTIFRPERYLPNALYILILATLFLPLISSMPKIHLLLQSGSLVAYLIFRWPHLYSIFNPPLINAQKIVGYSQMINLPIYADSLIFITILTIAPFMVLTYTYLTNQRHHKHSNSILLNWLMVILAIYVIENTL